MRVNVYAEEMTDRIEIISKQIDGHQFTGLRFYLELPCTIPIAAKPGATENVSGPFIHRPGDDDSSAVTFWGKRDLRIVLREALAMLDAHYGTTTKDRSGHRSTGNAHKLGAPEEGKRDAIESAAKHSPSPWTIEEGRAIWRIGMANLCKSPL